jgi:hypothetical protein
MPGPFYFAWAGGLVQEQITLVTTGNTHGASPEIIELVGDIGQDNAFQQVINLVSNKNLESGAFYSLSGPGVAPGTFFIFDDSILSGPPGTIAMSAPSTGSFTSTTFQATKSTIIGTVAGTLMQGETGILLPGIDLPPGVYGVAGTGIGITDTPVQVIRGAVPTLTAGSTTPAMTIGSALMQWDGSQGQLFILAAQSTITNPVAIDGQTAGTVAWTVAPQDVRATASGVYPIQITGFVDSFDAFLIDNVPIGVLGGLEPGLVYNITGNGIPSGATFVAPLGGTSLELDLPAESAGLSQILTISGPRTPTEPFSPTIHNRNDAELVSLEIAQEEGNFATLTVTTKNPGIGLLAVGRNLWCWLSWDQAWTPEGTNAPDLVPLFNGRLIGAPRVQAGELVQLQFLARPDDYNAQKNALATSLQRLPFYDPVWIASSKTTADTVLEGYSSLWHIDRASLEVTTSDVLEGEAGIIAVTEAQSIYADFGLEYGQPPLTAVTVSGTVSWQQEADGFLDITPKIVRAFIQAGSADSGTLIDNFSGNGGVISPTAGLWTPSISSGQQGGNQAATGGSLGGIDGGFVSSICGDGLKSDWPKPGTNIGGGWSLATLNDSRGIPLCYIVDATHNPLTGQGWLQPTYYNVQYAGDTGTSSASSGTSSNVVTMLSSTGEWVVSFPLVVFKMRMTLQYKADRKRTETVHAVVTSAVQPILSDPADQDREGIELTSQYVAEAVDLDGSIPIGNPSRRSYFQTERGAQSFEHLLLLARAKMRARSRAVDITFGTDWRTALPITLRHSVQYTDRRIPGGFAVGKVKSYKLTVADGKMRGTFTIGCAVGTGQALALPPTIDAYVNSGYVDTGYQAVTGYLPLNDDIGYQTLTDFSIIDDGVDFANLTTDVAVNECVVVDGINAQREALSQFQGGNPILEAQAGATSPNNVMATLTTTVTLDMKPLTGAEFHSDFFPDVAPLALPKLIDLSGASAAA